MMHLCPFILALFLFRRCFWETCYQLALLFWCLRRYYCLLRASTTFLFVFWPGFNKAVNLYVWGFVGYKYCFTSHFEWHLKLIVGSQVLCPLRLSLLALLCFLLNPSFVCLFCPPSPHDQRHRGFIERPDSYWEALPGIPTGEVP